MNGCERRRESRAPVRLRDALAETVAALAAAHERPAPAVPEQRHPAPPERYHYEPTEDRP